MAMEYGFISFVSSHCEGWRGKSKPTSPLEESTVSWEREISLSPLPAPAHVLREAWLRWDMAGPRCHGGAAGAGEEEPFLGLGSERTRFQPRWQWALEEWDSYGSVRLWGVASGTRPLKNRRKMIQRRTGVCLDPVCVRWLSKLLCGVTFLLVEYVRLSMVFIFFVFLLLKCQFANCSWACWQTSSWLLNFPSSPPSLLSLITWAEANSRARAAHHRHPLSLRGRRIRWWPVFTKTPNCTLGREHRFTPCYI